RVAAILGMVQVRILALRAGSGCRREAGDDGDRISADAKRREFQSGCRKREDCGREECNRQVGHLKAQLNARSRLLEHREGASNSRTEPAPAANSRRPPTSAS